MTPHNTPAIWAGFDVLIDECRALIDSSITDLGERRVVAAEPLPSLLDQCRELTRVVAQEQEPVRILSHFACTGGTVISKCIASMPNTRVLSEVAPHSRLNNASGRFFPSDLIRLIQLSDWGHDDALVSDIFIAGLREVHREATRHGARLVLRDHAHSKYCHGPEVSATPPVIADVSSAFPVVAALTVRHPLDSFLSLNSNQWLHFEPFTLGEYCERYARYLADHAELPIFSYEAFTQDPKTVTRALCGALELPFNEHFEELFAIQQLSGDSGRRSNTIGPRTRRAVPEDVRAQMEHPAYFSLCERLGYSAME